MVTTGRETLLARAFLRDALIEVNLHRCGGADAPEMIASAARARRRDVICLHEAKKKSILSVRTIAAARHLMNY